MHSVLPTYFDCSPQNAMDCLKPFRGWRLLACLFGSLSACVQFLKNLTRSGNCGSASALCVSQKFAGQPVALVVLGDLNARKGNFGPTDKAWEREILT